MTSCDQLLPAVYINHVNPENIILVINNINKKKNLFAKVLVFVPFVSLLEYSQWQRCCMTKAELCYKSTTKKLLLEPKLTGERTVHQINKQLLYQDTFLFREPQKHIFYLPQKFAKECLFQKLGQGRYCWINGPWQLDMTMSVKTCR